MAIIFSQSLSEVKFLNAFNNNIVKFYSDDVSPAVKATITVNGIDIVITPDSAGLFTYNFKTFFKTIVNQNNFACEISDEVFGDVGSPAYIYEDTNLYKDITVDFEITLESLATDTDQTTYRVLRSVMQLEEQRKGLINSNNNSNALLLPLIGGSINTFHATYFEGYPFDIPIYCDGVGQVQVKHTGTGLTQNFNVVKGVNRLFVSNGSDLWSFEDLLPLYTGVNHLTIRRVVLSTVEEINLYLTKKDGLCGTYLKWFNQSGGWSYHLFNTYQEKRKTRSLGDFRNQAQNIEDTVEEFTSIGTEAEDTIDLFYSGVTSEEKKTINTIFESPKIYRYVNDIFQNTINDDWMSETVKSGTVELFNKNKNIYEDGFTISKGQRLKMTF